MRGTGPGALAAVLLTVGLAGCVGALLQSKAAVPSVYLLSAHPAARLSGARGVIPVELAVQKPQVRSGLDTDRIAVLYTDRHLDYIAAARWSGPLDEIVQDLAVQTFRNDAGLASVSADSSAFAAGYWLEIDVLDFQAEYASPGAAPVIRVRLLSRVGAAVDRRVLGTEDAAVTQAADDNRVTAIAEAFERAVNKALSQIVVAADRTLAQPQSTASPVASANR